MDASQLALDRERAGRWAYDLLKTEFVILDTETTGLDAQAEICSLAVIRPNGSVLGNWLVKPKRPISAAAQQIHGLTDEAVGNSPPFDQVWLDLLRSTRQAEIVIYNAEFDLRMIRQSLAACDIQFKVPVVGADFKWLWPNDRMIHCAMETYAQYVGDWNPQRRSYRWQKLPGGDHSAIGDCRAVLGLIRVMAASYVESINKSTLETASREQ